MMTYSDGMKEFKAENYEEAAHQFVTETEQDDQNHKAWNALGICLSKTGQFDAAGTCFENAVTLDPGNATYKKNLDRNDKKRIIQEPEPELDDDPTPAKLKIASKVAASNQYTPVQMAMGVAALFILLIILGGACVSIIGGGIGNSPTQDDQEFRKIVNHFTDEYTVYVEEISTATASNDYAALKETSIKEGELAKKTLKQLRALSVSLKFKTAYNLYYQAIEEFEMASKRAIQGVESVENGSSGAAGFTAATNHMEKYSALVKQATAAL